MSNKLLNMIGFGGTAPNVANGGDPLPDIFPFSIIEREFVRLDIKNIYSKILTDVAERCHGLSAEESLILWDNCVKGESNDGLINLLAGAMADQDDLYLVFVEDLSVLRKADFEEQRKIKEDYAKSGESVIGYYFTFKNYKRTEMIKIYSAFEYKTVASLHKSMNLAKAIQIKISDLRKGVGNNERELAASQAKEIASALGNGKDVFMDKDDSVEAMVPQMTSVKEAIQFLDAKRCFYLGMPQAYVSGEQTGGIGSSGENDQKAVERGLKNYYFSIMKPALERLFDAKITYKSQDTRQINLGLEALKTFSLIDESLMSLENQQTIINQLFDFDTDGGSDEKGKGGNKKPPVTSTPNS